MVKFSYGAKDGPDRPADGSVLPRSEGVRHGSGAPLLCSNRIGLGNVKDDRGMANPTGRYSLFAGRLVALFAFGRNPGCHLNAMLPAADLSPVPRDAVFGVPDFYRTRAQFFIETPKNDGNNPAVSANTPIGKSSNSWTASTSLLISEAS